MICFEHMASYEAMSERCANMMLEALRRDAHARLMLATGYSPRLAYQLFASSVKREGIDIGHATIIKLDEWLGLAKDDSSTCEYFLRTELLSPISFPEEHYISFDSMCQDPESECERVSSLIQAAGGIDLAVLGIGRNGHLGLNEPAAQLRCPAHTAQLADQTLGHEMLKSAAHLVSRGLTLGMADILLARRIVLLAAGSGKEQALASLHSGMIDTQMPVSMLQLHEHITCLSQQG